MTSIFPLGKVEGFGPLEKLTMRWLCLFPLLLVGCEREISPERSACYSARYAIHLDRSLEQIDFPAWPDRAYWVKPTGKGRWIVFGQGWADGEPFHFRARVTNLPNRQVNVREIKYSPEPFFARVPQ